MITLSGHQILTFLHLRFLRFLLEMVHLTGSLNINTRFDILDIALETSMILLLPLRS